MSATPPPVEPVAPNVRPTRTTAAQPGRSVLAIAVAALVVALVATILATAPRQDPSPLAAGASAGTETAKPSGKAERVGKLREAFSGSFGRDITITAISGNDVSLETADGWKRTVTVTSTTEIRKGGTTGTVADLAVGDEVRLRQTRSDAGVYTVTAIIVPAPVTGGTVTAVDADSIDLKRRNGETQTVRITSATTYTVGKAAGTKADVVVGAGVAMTGTLDGTTFTAATVHVRLEGVSGEVTAKTSSTLTLTRRNGETVTVHVDSATTYRVRGNDKTAADTLADVTVGMRAGARGTLRADGSIDATRVEARAPRVKDAAPSPTSGG